MAGSALLVKDVLGTICSYCLEWLLQIILRAMVRV